MVSDSSRHPDPDTIMTSPIRAVRGLNSIVRLSGGLGAVGEPDGCPSLLPSHPASATPSATSAPNPKCKCNWYTSFKNKVVNRIEPVRR